MIRKSMGKFKCSICELTQEDGVAVWKPNQTNPIRICKTCINEIIEEFNRG